MEDERTEGSEPQSRAEANGHVDQVINNDAQHLPQKVRDILLAQPLNPLVRTTFFAAKRGQAVSLARG